MCGGGREWCACWGECAAGGGRGGPRVGGPGVWGLGHEESLVLDVLVRVEWGVWRYREATLCNKCEIANVGCYGAKVKEKL